MGVGWGEVKCVPLAGVKAKVRIRFAVLCVCPTYRNLLGRSTEEDCV